MSVSMIIACALLVTVLIASITDLKTGEIPQWLVFGSLGAGFVYQVVTHGFHAVVPVLLAVFTGLGLSFIGFWFGQFGAGDVKLYMALSAWVGTVTMAWSIWLYSSVAGGVIAVGMLFSTKKGRQKLVRGLMKIKLRFMEKEQRERLSATLESTKSSPLVMKYAPAIAVGTVAAIILGGVPL